MSVQDDTTPIDVLIEAPSIEENPADERCARCGHAAHSHKPEEICWVRFCKCLGFTRGFTR